MIEHLHEHIVDELRANTKTDTVFILASILLNLIALAVNAVVAGNEPETGQFTAQYTVISLFVALVVVVNLVVVLGLRRGKQNRARLLTGLLKMYADHDVSQYYDPTLLESYDRRYTLFTIVVVFTGIVSIAVPLVLLLV